MKTIIAAAFVMTLMSISAFAAVAGGPVGTAFTWQGRLLEGGAPVDGSVDLKFRLYDALTSGSQVGSEQTINDLIVADGKVTIDLDFGAEFDGTALWLEVDVRTVDTDPFETLSPRQPILPTPYAMHAAVAESVVSSAVPFNYSGSDAVFTGGNAAIGTATLNNPTLLSRFLRIDGDLGGNGAAGLYLSKPGLSNWAIFANSAGGFSVFDEGTPKFSIADAGSGGGASFQTDLSVSGSLGVGTDVPLARLHARHGPSLGATPWGSTIGLFEKDSDVSITLLSPDVDERAIFFGDPTLNVSGGIVYNNPGTPDGFQFRTNENWNRMVIDSTGNVGIGTITPAHILDVRGSVLVQGTPWGTAGDESTIYMGDTNHSIRSVFGEGVQFSTFGAPNALAIQESSGFVGIGTTTPVSLLDLNGELTHRGFTMTHLGADFVMAEPSRGDGGRALVHEGDGTDETLVINLANDFNQGVRIEGDTFIPDRLGIGAVPTTSYKLQTVSSIGGAIYASSSTNYATLSVDNIGNGEGVRADSNERGVEGRATADGSDDKEGVYGWASGENGDRFGVKGVVSIFSSGYGVYSNGDAHVDGLFTATGKLFKIDHPLDPENKILYHNCVESSEMMNIYNGNVSTDASGYATVAMPEWFEALNQDFRYQLTVIDEADSADFIFAKVVQKIANNEFTIRTSEPLVEVSWQVTGVRHDPWAEANRMPVEAEKRPKDKGLYFSAEAYGQPPDKDVDWRNVPDDMKEEILEIYRRSVLSHEFSAD